MYKQIIFFILSVFICFSNTKAENLSSNADEAKEFTMYSIPKELTEDATYYMSDGTPVLLSSHKGKVIILNFFKATCLKCMIEMPSLNELKDKYPDIILLAVSQGDETADIIDRILHEERLLNNIAVSLDNKQKLFFSVEGEKVPQTRLIDKKGMIRGYIKGQADFRSPKINEQIQNLLNESN